MSILQRIIDAIRRLFGWRPDPPVIEQPEPLPEQPGQPQEPGEPDPEPEQPTPDPEPPEPLRPVVVTPMTHHVESGAWEYMDDPLTTDGAAFRAIAPGDGELTATTMIELGDGVWTIHARVYAPDARSDAFYAGVRGHEVYRCWPNEHGRYAWVNCGAWTLSGQQRVGVGTGEVGLRLDCLVLDPTGLTPVELDELVGVPEHVEPIPEPEPPIEPEPEPPVIDPPVAVGTLRVRPYAPTGSEHQAHKRVLAYLDHVKAKTDAMDSGGLLGKAESANLYQLARPVRNAVTVLAQALAATGDQNAYQALDTVLEKMRGALKRGWRDVFDATGGSPPAPGGNGYVEPGQHPDGIWVWRTAGNKVHTGRDVHLLDSPKTAALVAQIAMVYRDNGNTSKRDYWLTWLQHWEDTWRSSRWRRGRPKTGPIFARGDGHVSHAELVFYEHMHRLTGEVRWGEYAKAMIDHFWRPGRGFAEAPTPTGPAWTWYRGNPDAPATAYACPATYARYFFADALELHRLGVENYDTESMRRFARAIAHHVLLPTLPTTSTKLDAVITHRDISGGKTIGGIPASPADEWNGLTLTHWASWTSWPLFEQWDDTGRIKQVNDVAQARHGWGDKPKGYALPVAQLLVEIGKR